MSLWRTAEDPSGSESDNDIQFNDVEETNTSFAPLSTREAQKALRRETNSTYDSPLCPLIFKV